MARRPKTPEDIGNATFVGSLYSNEELAFLLEHLGESPDVALGEDEDLPPGVNAAQVRPILDRCFRLNVLQEAASRQTGKPVKLWVGVEAVQDICEKTLTWNETVRDLKERTQHADPSLRRAANAPSLCMWDPDTDVPYPGGVGADADIVRTALDGGRRVPLYIVLRDMGVGSLKGAGDVAAFLRGKKTATGSGAADMANKLLENTPNALLTHPGDVASRIECPICGHSATYETHNGGSKKAAEKDMMTHLKKAKVKKDQHQLLAKRLLSGKAGTGKALRDDPEPVEDETGDDAAEE